MGFFNANSIVIDNSVFINIEENAINYLRATHSPDIPGGSLIVKNSIFNNVYNQEKGKIIRTDGIHKVEIINSVIENSYKVKTAISLKGRANIISNCLIHNSGFVKTSQNAKKENVLYKSPKWEDKQLFIPSKKSPLLKEKNGIATIGLKQ